MNISGKRIAILATHGFEQSELEVPLKRLKEAGATVDVVSPESGEIKGWEMKDWGHPVKVDRKLADVSADNYDAIVLPGGQINPDLLRINQDALRFIRAFFACGLGGDREPLTHGFEASGRHQIGQRTNRQDCRSERS